MSPTGALKIFHIDNYEFWAMTHTLKKTGTSPASISSFQVAIKNIESNWFAHALSNQLTGKPEPQTARLSLATYANNGFFEIGEILFECKTSQL